MAYQFLKLDEIPDYVSDRLDSYKNNKEVSRLGVWVKLTSTAGEESLGKREAGLSIVSNPNIPTFGMKSIHGSLEHGAPIGSKSFDGNAQSYETRNRDGIGYSPRPLIENVTITNGTRGLSRKAEFTIRCYTQSQADEISRYFLEPGFSVCIEWGWNVSDSYHQLSRDLDDISNLQNFDELEERRLNSNGTYDAYYGIVTGGGMTNSDGTYNVSVKCAGIGEVFSMIQSQKKSTVFESLSDGEVDDENDKSEQTGVNLKHTSKTFENDLESFIYMFNDLPDHWRTPSTSKLIDDEDVSHHSHFINFIPAVRDKLNGETKSAGWFRRTFLRQGTVETDDGTARVPSGDGIVSDDRYVRFGVLMKLLNTGIYNYEQGLKMSDGKYTPVSVNTKNVPISAFRNIFSVDGSKLYIPNKQLPDFGLLNAFTNIDESSTFSDRAKTGSTVDPRKLPYLSTATLYREFPREAKLSDNDFSAEPYTYGYLDDLYINFDFALSVLNRKGLGIKDVMYELLNGMSSAANNQWDFQIVEDVDSETGQLIISVVDYDFIGFKEKEVKELISVGTESPFESFSFDMDIPGAMMNQILGRRLTEDNSDPQDELNEMPNQLFGDGVRYKDFSILRIETSDDRSKPKPLEAAEEETENDIIQRNFEFFMKRATITPTITTRNSALFIEPKPESKRRGQSTSPYADNIDQMVSQQRRESGRDLQFESGKNELNYVLVNAWNDPKLFTELRKIGNGGRTTIDKLSPLLPITTTWSTFGISGLRNGLTYRILDLPEKYRGIGIFQITEISHTISGMKWTTSVEGKFRQSSK